MIPAGVDSQDANADNTYEVRILVSSGPAGGEADRETTGVFTVIITDDDSEAPEAPQNPMIRNESRNTVSLAWGAPANTGPPLSGYQIQVRIGGQADNIQVLTLPPGFPAHDVSGLTANRHYQVSIAAANAEGVGPRTAWVDAFTDDCGAANDSTACTLPIGGELERRINSSSLTPDTDWFAVTLDSSKSYFVDVKGSEVSDSGGTLGDPKFKIFDSSGSAVSGAEDDNGGEGSNARLVFVPPSTDTYYIEVGEHGGDDTGTYTVSVVANSLPRFTGNLQRSMDENRNLYFSLQAVDDDPGDVIYTYGATGGADLGAFHSFPDGSLTLAGAPDFENPHDANQDNVYEIEVVVYSGPQGGAATQQTTATFALTIVNVTEPPGTPRQFRNSQEGLDQLKVAWDNPHNNGPPISGYVIEVREGTPGSTARSLSSAPGFLEYEVTGLMPNQHYQVRVAAANVEGVGPWTAWVDAFTDDCGSANDSTACTLPLDSSKVGRINLTGSTPDTDWFSVDLQSGDHYFVDVKGSEVSDSGGTLGDPEVKIFDSSGSAVSGAEDDNGGEGSNARLVFVPPSTDTYYIEVGEHGGDDTGTYTVSVVANSLPRFTGNLQRSMDENRNLYFSLQAVDDDPGDVIYTYGATGGADLGAFHSFPDGSLTLAGAPDFENPHDANQDNVYEIEVVVYSGPQGGAATQQTTATFTVTVTDDDTEAPNVPRKVQGTQEESDQLTITWNPARNNGPPITGYQVQIAPQSPTLSWQTTTVSSTSRSHTWQSLSPGIEYVVQVRAINAEGEGPWNPRRTLHTDDCAAAASNACAVSVGSSVIGRINVHDSTADTDWFAVALEAGTEYRVEVKGSETSDQGGTLDDPEFEIFNSSGDAITGAENDNGGMGMNARYLFTPSTDGTYYIVVGEHGGDDTGTYTVSVVVN